MSGLFDLHWAVAALAIASAGLFGLILWRKLAQVRHRTVELARTNRELKTLRELSAIFSSVAPDTEIFEKLFDCLRAALPIRALAVVSYEEDPDGRASVALHGEATIERRTFLDWLAAQRDLETTFVQATAEPRIATGPARDLALNPQLPFHVLLPLQTPELIAGLLVVESDASALVEPQTLQELSVLADHVALSLQDRSLRRQMQAVNERLQSRADTLHRILEVSNELKAHLTIEHVLASIVRAVSNSFGFHTVMLYLYDRTENVFERRTDAGLERRPDGAPPARVPREEIAQWFSERYRISKSYFVSHLDRQTLSATTGKIERRRRGAAPGSWHPLDLLFIPLTAADQLIGVLQVDEPKSGLVPKLEDVQALEIFANQAVTAIQSARAYETTRQMSVRDSLTEAFNHRYFQETLYRELTRHERSGSPLALLMVDLDDFKRVNDRWGHPVGDIVLRGLVDELTKGSREMDTVARYGGEEFALILPETTPARALIAAERLRNRVASRLFVSPEIPHPLAVTISLGVACYPDDANSKRALVERADQALYQAKRNGKNCVVTASSLADLQAL
jgi:diguanylate cyclase (GGDEF)-like protein